MENEELHKLDYAYRTYGEVFDRHFKSFDDAKKNLSEALSGNDRTQVKLWKFYQDAKYDERTAKKSQGQYTLYDVIVKTSNVVNREEAARFKKLAQEASNIEAVDFVSSVRLGNRDPLAYYAIYNHGEDNFYDLEHPLKNLKFQENPHFRYKEDIWWNDLRNIDYRNAPYIYITVASKHTYSYEFLAFIEKTYLAVIPALEECAKAGYVTAAEELHHICSAPFLQYDLDKIFFSKRKVENPFFYSKRADYWNRVHNFLLGKGNEDLLDNFILSQDSTSEGQFNIGVALMNNQHVLAAYNRRKRISDDNSNLGIEFLKRAANSGNPSAAWYYANLLHSNAEPNNDMTKLKEAISWYHKSAELGHPNSKYRYRYLTEKGETLTIDGESDSELHSNPDFTDIKKGNVFISHASEDKDETLEVDSESDSELHSNPDITDKMEWDAFISHASEDKDDFVRPLAIALQSRGLKVWYDEFTLKVGDSLRRSIERGLTNSKYGIVVISPNFLKKEWPQRELDGLISLEVDGRKVILPIWHNIDFQGVRNYSPTLADRVAVRSSIGIDKVADTLIEAIKI
ncbi:MAG: hypothetical protein ILNGONEN_01664 [Syntrophorhabdaceae bacterium]|nr:hypothetical protein [Syntrophorhabdaceae bacterium]